MSCPVFFVRQLDDESHTAASAQARFDRIPDRGNPLRSSPGAHEAVPEAVHREALAFLAAKLAAPA